MKRDFPRKQMWILPTIALALATWGVGCNGPIVMIPGGALSGPVAPTPTDWAFSDSVDTIQLETRPGDPYSVNVWGTGLGPDLLIACADPTSAWCDNLKADSRARVRIEGTIYELSARLVEDEASRERALVALKKKYDFEPSAEDKDKALLFVLGPR